MEEILHFTYKFLLKNRKNDFMIIITHFNFYTLCRFITYCSNNDYECKDINIPDSLNNNNNNNIYLRNLYRKYIRNIKNIKNGNFSKIKNIDNGQNVEQLCIYLKYWIYDIIANNVRSDSDISTFFNTWNSEKNSLFSDNKCPCEIYKMDLKEINEIRKLYDYYMLYDTFEETKSINDKNYITEYCSYLKQFKEIYNKTSCNANVSDNYCKEFNNYIKENVKVSTLLSIDEYCEEENVNKLNDPKSVDPKKSDYSAASKKYGIFQVLDQYHKDKVKLIKATDDNNYNNICDIECASDRCIINHKEICEKYTKKFLSLFKPNNVENTFRNDYAKILNYLFNQELRNGQLEHNNKEYYEKIKEKCSSDIKLSELKDNISYIEDEEYKKLNILYQLYDNLRKIDPQTTQGSRQNKSSPLGYDEKFVNIYKEGITLYEEKKDKKDQYFYYALKEFSFLYKKYIYMEVLSGNKKLKELPYFQAIDDSKKESDVQQEIYSINSNIRNIYKKLSNHISDKTLCAKYCSEIISSDKNNNDGIKSLCVKLVTILKKLNTLTDVGDNHKDKCSNLIYWTYDQIMNIFDTTASYYENSSISNEINKVIIRVNDELNANSNCYFYVDGDFDQWNKERDLHDYFAHFENLNKITPGEGNRNSNYCSYLKYINRLYKEHIKGCCTRYIRPDDYMENKCPSYFNCEEKYYPIDLMTKLKCENIDHIESVKDIFDSITVDLNVIRYSIFMSSFNQIINITNDPFYLFVLAAFGLLGFFFIFFIFYKVTRDTTYIYVHIFYVNFIIYFPKTFRIMKYMYYK
ncbi:hypothetical protein PVNG_03342 [Plasmodium vivax North Korean]|uniref:Uncharacterized protein n=1 Tax=Plasmodium vivax North Korean TaxID=1035514 RepID=A0A0J9TQL8_PLAVI|nr:hypothetical protein PVNG_03342 [Plasmodium vivax North Korean]